MPNATEPEFFDFLLAQVCHLRYSRAHQFLDAIGLYRGQPPFFQALWKQEGLTHTQLAANLRVSPSTITKRLQRMEKAGFIVRKLDTGDERVSRVYLTEAGHAIQAQVQATFGRMESDALSGLTLEEGVLLRRFLLQLCQNLERATGQSPCL